MQPDYCFEAIDNSALISLRESVKCLKDSKGKIILTERYTPRGLRINLFLESSSSIVDSGNLFFKDKLLNIEDIGLELIFRDIGTAYHIPNGIFGCYGPEINRFSRYKNKSIYTTRICPTILDIFNLNTLDYMEKPITSL